MKKTLQVLGAIFGILLIGIVIMIVRAATTGRVLDESSKAYIDEAVPAIISTWSKEELLKRAAPALIEADQKVPGQGEKMFAKLGGALGALKAYKGSTGESSTHYGSKAGKVITAQYFADATFEKGDARILVRLVQTDGQWQIVFFHVNSPVLLD
jgi:hypothetical protein